jgi:hypothetical protein
VCQGRRFDHLQVNAAPQLGSVPEVKSDRKTMPSFNPSAHHGRAGQARYMPVSAHRAQEPEGAILPDVEEEEDRIAVVYARGETPPEITISRISGTLQMVLADGVAVAIVASQDASRLRPQDVLLVERFVSGG